MLNCRACPFYIDCKVGTENKPVLDNIGRALNVYPANPIETTHLGMHIVTPRDEADCPLKQAVEAVNRQLDKTNILPI